MWFENLLRKSRRPSFPPKNIFVGLIGGVGDLVLAAPSVAELKKKFPEASICFGVGPPPFHSAIKNDPHIDRFETPFAYNVWRKRERRAVERKKAEEFDLTLLLDNPDRDWWKAKKHLIDIYAERCGVSLETRRPAMYLSREDEAQGDEVLRRLGIAREDKLIVLAPEARSKKEIKEWPHSHFTRLIETIHKERCVKMVTFVSPSDLREYPGTAVVKDPPIGAAAAVIRRADLFIGLDNGLTHIAGRFDGRIVSVHIGFPAECCGVLSPNATVIAHEPFCRPDSIPVEEVYEKVDGLL
ncbi:MAG: glycosyltransferase family 9 protein [Nitrospinae bacterium]|nr:glycosyltransferase family 9 protein [Nitrospinota bacterium]